MIHIYFFLITKLSSLTQKSHFFPVILLNFKVEILTPLLMFFIIFSVVSTGSATLAGFGFLRWNGGQLLHGLQGCHHFCISSHILRFLLIQPFKQSFFAYDKINEEYVDFMIFRWIVSRHTYRSRRQQVKI